MKSHSFFPAVTIVAFLIAIAVQEAHLVSPVGRRFGRSVDKKYVLGRSRTAHFYDEQISPLTKDEHEAAQQFYEYPLVRHKKAVFCSI